MELAYFIVAVTRPFSATAQDLFRISVRAKTLKTEAYFHENGGRKTFSNNEVGQFQKACPSGSPRR
jgi:hypothetical protein